MINTNNSLKLPELPAKTLDQISSELTRVSKDLWNQCLPELSNDVLELISDLQRADREMKFEIKELDKQIVIKDELIISLKDDLRENGLSTS